MARNTTTTTYTNNLGETITLTEGGFVALEGFESSPYACTRRDPAVGERVILGTSTGYRVVTIERETKAQVFVEGVAYWKNRGYRFFRTVKNADEFGVLYFAGSGNGFEDALSQLTDEERALLAGEDAQPEPATLEDEEAVEEELSPEVAEELAKIDALPELPAGSFWKVELWNRSYSACPAFLALGTPDEGQDAKVRELILGGMEVRRTWIATPAASGALRTSANLEELKKRGVSE